jgi:hypothetical protein
MQLLTPLAAMLGFQLMHTTVLAETPFDFCQCIDTGDHNKVDASATHAACDLIDHSDYSDHDQTCYTTDTYGVMNSCFDCL